MVKSKQVKSKQQNLENSVPVTRQQLWEKLLDQGYVISPPITTVSAHWLYEGENRLDGGYYGSNAQTAKIIVNDCGYTIETLGNITEEIFILGRFKRVYASDKKAGYPLTCCLQENRLHLLQRYSHGLLPMTIHNFSFLYTEQTLIPFLQYTDS